MRVARAWRVGVVVVSAVAACSNGGPSSSGGPSEGGPPEYDAGSDGGGATDSSLPEAASEASADTGVDSTTDARTDAGADATTDTGSDSAADSATDSGAEAGADTGADSATDAATDSATDAGADAAVDSAADAGTDSGTDAAAETGSDAETEAGADAAAQDGGDAGAADASFVAPTCDGVVSAGEYGGAANQAMSGTQTWLMTWDDTNLYVAIENALVTEANVVYVATASGADAGWTGGLAQGQSYDNTDITSLPFAASLAVYAKDGYTEARTPSGGSWALSTAATVQICDDTTTNVREEVVPWALLGGRPASFGWIGYVAANPNGNPQGYVYGQMPADDPGGAPANNLTYTTYYDVPDADVPAPFAHEQ